MPQRQEKDIHQHKPESRRERGRLARRTRSESFACSKTAKQITKQQRRALGDIRKATNFEFLSGRFLQDQLPLVRLIGIRESKVIIRKHQFCIQPCFYLLAICNHPGNLLLTYSGKNDQIAGDSKLGKFRFKGKEY